MWELVSLAVLNATVTVDNILANDLQIPID